MRLSTTEEIIEDIRLGRMVILMDDEDRENEGDIMVASDKVTPEIVNFMVKEGRGLLCQTLTQSMADRLNLAPMVTKNTERFGTNFTISIDSAKRASSGISTNDRAMTIRDAASSKATAADFVSPGHIFPIVAKEGGVLVRNGHTEAGCDIAALAGLTPSCAIIEVLNQDGTMARRGDLEHFAKKHQLKLGTIADLIEYRLRQTRVVEIRQPSSLELSQAPICHQKWA